MENLKNNASAIKYKIESKSILKLKELIRTFREKKLFYLEHSKFATYADSEYLDVFQEEIIEFSKAWIRMQQKNMNSEKNPGLESHANARGLHVMDTAINAREVSKDLLLNEVLAFIGGLIHDIAHTAFAHEGEYLLSKFLEKKGICELHHSSLSRLILELEEIHVKVLKRLEQKKGRPLTKREQKQHYSTYLTISDIAVCHNGEGGLTQVATNRKKTDEDVDKEYIDTFTKKGFSRKTRNRSKEGTIVLFCDPISYIAKDFRDGVIKGLIDVNDPDFEELFIKMGLPKKVLDVWASEPRKKDRLVSWVTRFFKDNLSLNSQGIDGARMEREVAELMYELRTLNYEKVVKPGIRKIYDILPERLEVLIEKFSNILVQYQTDGLDSSLELTPNGHKMLRSITSQSDKIDSIYKKIVSAGTEQYIRTEVDEVLSENSSTITIRRKRIEEDLEELKRNGDISGSIKEAYIQRLLKETLLSPKSSNDLLEKRIKTSHPEATQEELRDLIKQNQYLRLETQTESLAKLKVSIYIGEATNDYFLNLLESEGLITPQELQKRYQSGGNIGTASINDVIAKQQEEKNEGPYL